MSQPIVKGDYDGLQNIATTFAQEGERAGQTLQALKKNIDTLRQGDWVGTGATAFYTEMDGSLLPAMQRLERALREAGRVTQTIRSIIQQAEDDAARVFRLDGGIGSANAGAQAGGQVSGSGFDTAAASGGGEGSGSGGGTSAASSSVASASEAPFATMSAPAPMAAAAPAASGAGAPQPPKNMGELMTLIYSQTSAIQPAKIIQTGPNDYMVLVRGTDPINPYVSENWGGAADSGLVGTSDFTRQVQAYMQQNIPPGANITFAGHSQGGITVNNLADNQDLRGDYNIKSVITFGSPPPPFQQPGTNYHSVTTPLDPVPYLDRRSLANPGQLVSNLLGAGKGLVDTASRIATGTIDNLLQGKGLVDSVVDAGWSIPHANYRNSAANIPLPPETTFSQFTPVDSNFTFSPPQHGLASVWHNAGYLNGNPLYAGYQTTKMVGLGLANNLVVDPLINKLPTGTRNAIDGFRDRVVDKVMTSGTLLNPLWPITLLPPRDLGFKYEPSF